MLSNRTGREEATFDFGLLQEHAAVLEQRRMVVLDGILKVCC
jgi:hypothetical protein